MKNYFLGLEKKFPSFDGKFKVIFRRNDGESESIIVTEETFEEFLESDSAAKGGKLFIYFESNDEVVLDKNGAVVKNKQGEPVRKGKSAQKNLARAMSIVAQAKGFATRMNSSGMLVFKDKATSAPKRVILNVPKRPRGKPRLSPIIREKVKAFRRAHRPKASVPKVVKKENKSLWTRIFG